MLFLFCPVEKQYLKINGIEKKVLKVFSSVEKIRYIDIYMLC